MLLKLKFDIYFDNFQFSILIQYFLMQQKWAQVPRRCISGTFLNFYSSFVINFHNWLQDSRFFKVFLEKMQREKEWNPLRDFLTDLKINLIKPLWFFMLFLKQTCPNLVTSDAKYYKILWKLNLIILIFV